MFSNMADEQSLQIENMNKRASRIISSAIVGTGKNVAPYVTLIIFLQYMPD